MWSQMIHGSILIWWSGKGTLFEGFDTVHWFLFFCIVNKLYKTKTNNVFLAKISELTPLSVAVSAVPVSSNWTQKTGQNKYIFSLWNVPKQPGICQRLFSSVVSIRFPFTSALKLPVTSYDLTIIQLIPDIVRCEFCWISAQNLWGWHSRYCPRLVLILIIKQNFFSPGASLCWGVPQGSIQGPVIQYMLPPGHIIHKTKFSWMKTNLKI